MQSPLAPARWLRRLRFVYNLPLPRSRSLRERFPGSHTRARRCSQYNEHRPRRCPAYKAPHCCNWQRAARRRALVCDLPPQWQHPSRPPGIRRCFASPEPEHPEELIAMVRPPQRLTAHSAAEEWTGLLLAQDCLAAGLLQVGETEQAQRARKWSIDTKNTGCSRTFSRAAASLHAPLL